MGTCARVFTTVGATSRTSSTCASPSTGGMRVGCSTPQLEEPHYARTVLSATSLAEWLAAKLGRCLTDRVTELLNEWLLGWLPVVPDL